MPIAQATSSVSSRRRFLGRVLPPLFFAIWAVAFTYPLALHLADNVILLRGSDAWLHLWDLWWVDKSLVGLHQNPYQTTYLYYPTGLNLYYHSLNLLNGLVSIPLQHLFGLTVSFNLLLLGNLTLDGLAAYWLCRERTGSVGAGLVGGALFASAPLLGTSVNLGQLDEVTVWWVPLYLLALYRTLDSPGPAWRKGGGRRATLYMGLCLAGASLATWYFTAGLVIFTIFFVPCYLFSKRGSKGNGKWQSYQAALWKAAAKVGLGALLFVLLLGPLLMSMVKERLSGATYMLPSLRTTIVNSADIVALFAPARLDLPTINIHQSTVALGYAAIILGVVGLAARRRYVWPLAVAFLAVLIMSLGPVLQVAGSDTGVPMPYSLLNSVPFIGASRQPLRFLATASMALALMGAYGMAWLLSRAGTANARSAAVAGVLFLLVVELFGIPRALVSTQSGPAYSFLKSRKEEGAVLELPADAYSALSLLHQTAVELPIIGGYTSRHFPYPFVDAAPGVAQLYNADPTPLTEPDVLTPPVPDTALANLDYYNVRYVVVHKDDLKTGRYGPLEDALDAIFDGQEPAYEDGEVKIYRTPNTGESDQRTKVPLVGLGAGWYKAEPKPVHRWTGSNVTDGNALVWIGIPPGTEGAYRLNATVYSYQIPRHLTLELDGKPLLQKEVGTAFSDLSVDLGRLDSGSHILMLKVLEPPVNPPGDERKLAIGVTRLEVVRSKP